jgi:hypothetical protein
LFGPDVDVEILKKSISKSELFGEVGGGLCKNGHNRKSFDFGIENGELHIGDIRRDRSPPAV